MKARAEDLVGGVCGSQPAPPSSIGSTRADSGRRIPEQAEEDEADLFHRALDGLLQFVPQCHGPALSRTGARYAACWRMPRQLPRLPMTTRELCGSRTIPIFVPWLHPCSCSLNQSLWSQHINRATLRTSNSGALAIMPY